MVGRLLLCQTLILLALAAAVWGGNKLGLDNEGHKLLPPLSGSMLRYGTMGKLLKEQGLISSTRANGYQRINLDDIEPGTTRLSFTVESGRPIRGTVFWHDNNEKGFAGLQGGKVGHFHTDQGGTNRLGLLIDSIDQIAKLRVDVETLNVKVKLSNFELVSDNLVSVMLNTKDEYQEIATSEDLKVLKVDDSGLEFVTTGDSYFTYTVDAAKFKQSGFSSLFGKKRSLSDYTYHSAQRAKAPADLPKSITSKYPGIATVSMSVPEGTFDDIYGIVTHLESRGRDFERPIDVSYYDETGKKVFTSSVGLRYHGGKNRAKRASYRFYFREDYASSKYMPSLVFPEQPLESRSIVLHHTKFPEFSPVSHLLAIDLWRAIGVDTPRTKPATLYINGEYDGFYYLTDHISKSNFQRILRSTDFKFYRLKSQNDQEDRIALYQSLLPFRGARGSKVSANEVASAVNSIYQNFDVEGITNLMVANTVFNTEDYCQGALYRRDDLGETQWRVVGWDFDGAFLKNFVWTVPVVNDNFNVVKQALYTDRYCVLAEIFTYLLRNSPEYRQLFWQKLVDSVNTIYSPEALLKRLNQYREKYQGRLGVTAESFDMLDAYFRKRPAFVKRQTRLHLERYEAL